ncbi:MAG: histidinol-phosphate transaminase [Candidatus Margulisbacteria bacterium]|nr:histidinol-phosphate transaminase [Candidatus Margulisiibacteriota bacterium]MBU1616682.1 histidinol-phosphate transaminase [Candidatus Margulisiibacteriota bacterium]
MAQLREALSKLRDYVPGKPPVGPKGIKLSSNENPFGPSPLAVKAIAKETGHIQAYPDQRSGLLREAIAKKFKISPESVIAGNGSDEIMLLLAATFLRPGEEAIICENSFSLYEFVVRLFEGNPVLVPLDHYHQDLEAIARVITSGTKFIFLTNPHNPTGTFISRSELERFLARVPKETLVVVDEAYAEFAESVDFPGATHLLGSFPNVVFLRTFSKYYGLAGLRIGYALADPLLASPMFKAKLPFNVNRLAQSAALAALSDRAFLEKTYKNNLEGKKDLYALFDKYRLSYLKSEANFIFVRIGRSADNFCQAALERGVSLRPLTSFGLPDAIRVSVGTKEQNKQFIKVFEGLI